MNSKKEFLKNNSPPPKGKIKTKAIYKNKAKKGENIQMKFKLKRKTKSLFTNNLIASLKG